MNQSEGVTDESKRQHMERLVRDELERWDSESCISSRYDPSPPSSTSGRAAAQAASDHSQVECILSNCMLNHSYRMHYAYAQKLMGSYHKHRGRGHPPPKILEKFFQANIM